MLSSADPGIFWDLGFDPSYLTNGNSLYTIITSIFVHANIIHLIFNIVWLALIGIMLEERAGKLNMGVLYFLTGIIGNLVFAASYGFNQTIVVGASGAIYGIFGSYVRLYPTQRLRLYFLDFPVYIWFLIFLFLDLMMAFIQPFFRELGFIAFTAHIGGLVSGYLLAPSILTLSGKKIINRKFERLKPLATTLYLEEILEKLTHEDDPSIQKDWLNEFLKRAKCPKCGKKLMKKTWKIVCENDDYTVRI